MTRSTQSKERGRFTNCKGSYAAVLLAFLVIWATSAAILFPAVNAFKVIDHAMCKGIKCTERTNQFLLTDDYATLQIRGSFESSDSAAEVGLKFYDPCGRVFASGPARRTEVVSPIGEISATMGIAVAQSGVGGYFLVLVLSRGAGLKIGDELVTNRLWAQMSVAENAPKASEKPGEWRAEFTLAGKSIVSESFTIGTETTSCAPELPSMFGVNSFPLIVGIAAVVVVTTIIAVYILGRNVRVRNSRKNNAPRSIRSLAIESCLGQRSYGFGLS